MASSRTFGPNVLIEVDRFMKGFLFKSLNKIIKKIFFLWGNFWLLWKFSGAINIWAFLCSTYVKEIGKYSRYIRYPTSFLCLSLMPANKDKLT